MVGALTKTTLILVSSQEDYVSKGCIQVTHKSQAWFIRFKVLRSVYLKLFKGIIEVSEEMNRKSNWARKTNARCNPKCLREQKATITMSRLLRLPMRNPDWRSFPKNAKNLIIKLQIQPNFFPACQTSIMRDSKTSQCSDQGLPRPSYNHTRNAPWKA